MEVATFEGRRSRFTLIAFISLLLLLLIGNFYMVASYLLAVLMGGILAIIFRRFYLMLVSKKVWPSVSAGIVTTAIALLIIVPIIVFAYMAVQQAITIAQSVAKQPDISLSTLSEKLVRWKPLQTYIGNASAIEAKARQATEKIGSLAPGVIFGIFGGVPLFALQLGLTLFSCYFFLLDGRLFVDWLRDKLPLEADVRSALFRSFRETAVSTLLATILSSIVQASIVTAGFLIFGVPAAILAFGVTFICSWIPVVGCSPVWVMASLYLFSHGSSAKGIAMLGVGMAASLSDNISYPVILKGKGQMHPLISLVAIFGGIELFGALGVFVGPILAALLVSVLKIWPDVATRFGLLKSCQIVTEK